MLVVSQLALLLVSISLACIPTISPDADDEYDEMEITFLATMITEQLGQTSPATTTTTSTTTTTTTTAPCPSAMWELDTANNECYILISPGVVPNIDSACSSMFPGSHAASIANADENAFVTNYLVNVLMTGPNIYIGGTSTTGAEGSWSWTDGSPFGYENWYTAGSYPMAVSIWNCLFISASADASEGQWINGICDSGNPILCKIAAV